MKFEILVNLDEFQLINLNDYRTKNHFETCSWGKVHKY